MGIWVTDAERLGVLSVENVFVNRSIHDFLTGDRVFWIVASKGMGKTLLLRYKRDVMESGRGSSGVFVLPQNKSLDYVHIPSSLPIAATKSMRDRQFWKDLWEISITLSIVLNFPLQDVFSGTIHEAESLLRDLGLDNDLSDDLNHAIHGQPRKQPNPSDLLVRLLQGSVAELQKVRRFAMQPVYNLYTRYVRSGVCVFIDSFDQALRETYPDDLDIWIQGQLGLLLAAWEISRHNPHIKVYTSIRQEAYAAFRDENRQAIFGSMLMLKYTPKDLLELLDKSVHFFEQRQSLIEFVGMRSIKNEYASHEEDIFDYTYRHVIPTPRSFMVVGNEISRHCGDGKTMQPPEREERFRETINRCTATEICQDYLLGEMNMFLSCLKAEHNLACLFKMIFRNVLTRTMLGRISRQFNEVLKRDGVWPGRNVHPFCELYNIGLLGSVNADASSIRAVQSFRKPYDFDWDMEEILPDSPFYFIHPSLHSLAQRYNPRYRISRVLIGDGYAWRDDYASVLRGELLRVFLSYTSKDRPIAEKIALSLENNLSSKGAFVDVWYDKWRVRAGQWVQQAVEEGLARCDVLIVIVSKDSLKSGWVEAEWRKKFQDEIELKRGRVLPVVLDVEKAELPSLLQMKQPREVRRRPQRAYGDDIERLCEDVLAMAEELGKHFAVPRGEDSLR